MPYVGFLVAALLVLTRVPGLGYHGQFVSDAFSAFNKVLILAAASLTAILALDYNRKQGIARFEFPVLLDPSSQAANLYNTHKTAPYTVIIGRDGKIAQESSGFDPAAAKPLEDRLEKLLAGT